MACVFLTFAMTAIATAQARNSINQGFETPQRGDLPAGAINAGDGFANAFQIGQSLVPGWSSTHPSTCSNAIPGGPQPCIEIFDNASNPANPPLGPGNNDSAQFAELNADTDSAAFLADVCLIQGETLNWTFFIVIEPQLTAMI